MERSLDGAYELIYALKDHMNISCERRVFKEDHVKESDRVSSAIASVALATAEANSRVDLSNTTLNNRITNLIWKGLAGLLFAYIVMAGMGKWLHDEISSEKRNDDAKWAAMQSTLHSIDKTVSTMNVRVNYTSQDLNEIKDKLKKDTK